MRQGFTTGSCAAAASKAAAKALLLGTKDKKITIITPKGIEYYAEIVDYDKGSDYCRCAVIKDGGDDPDITTGAHIYAEVRLCNEGIAIKGGEGVGVVTKPGLDQNVGEAAINHVPRQMIKEAVFQVAKSCDYEGGFEITISVPEGVEIAKKTFNPRLGIEGGISIIGTSGIVEPMSMQAIKDTIKVELSQKKAEGDKYAIVSPGNYGIEFMNNNYGYDLDKSVKCSNFIGDTIDMAGELGFEKILIAGHIGKLVKVSGGIMNTHSKEADCRMELLAAAFMRCMNKSEERDFARGQLVQIINDILQSATTENALKVLDEALVLEETMAEVLKSAVYYLNKRANGIEVECIMFSNEMGLLCESEGAKGIIDNLRG